jgi:ketosteroid isomerase-like protein
MGLACKAPQEKPIEELRQPEEQVLEELMTLEDGAMERWRQGDPGGWAELAGPEITYFDPGHNHRVDGLQAYREFCDQVKSQISYDSSAYTHQKVQLHGDVAVLTYNYTSETVADDNAITLGAPWNTTEVYSRIDGQWKIVHTHWGYKNSTKPEELEPDWPEPTAPEQTQGLLSELLGMENSAMERWRQGDPWGWIEISANEVTYFDPETDRRKDGIEQLRELYAAIDGQVHYDSSYFISPKVQEHGDVAILTYHYISRSTGEDGAEVGSTYWNTTEVYSRIDGQWKIIHTHWSYNMAQPQQTEPQE